MKKTLLLILFSISVFSQKTSFDFNSKVLNTTREITIGLPASFGKNPDKKYPLLIVLDSEYLFDPFYTALTYGAYWDDMPEVITIGVNQNKNNERIEDCRYDEVDLVPTGKGAQFFEFIGAELLPYLEKKYPIAPLKIIAGHDTTAGFLNFFLYKDNPIFNGYISLSPELIPEMENRIPEQVSKLKKPLFYYQSNGEGDLEAHQKDIQELDYNIKKIRNSLLNYTYDSFKGASHYSLVLYSIPNSLYGFFDTYKPISPSEYQNKIAILESGYVDYLTNKYEVLYKTLGLKIPVRLNDFRAIEAAILKNKAYSDLDKLAQVANKYYPKSMLSTYQLALMYEKMGDIKRALKYYQNASQLEPIGILTKGMMLDKYDDLKSSTSQK